MKKYILFAIVALAGCNFPGKQQKTYTFKEVGWTMTLPGEFKVLDSTGVDKTNQNGKALMEKSTGAQLDISSTRTLISAKKGNSTFTATITPFDTAKDGDYAAACNVTKGMLYKTFSVQMPDATLDSVSERKKIGGLDFDAYHITVSLKSKSVYTIVILVRLQKGYDFGISYLYTDDRTKAQIEGILSGSKFNQEFD